MVPSYHIYRRTRGGKEIGNWLARAYVSGEDHYRSTGTKSRTEAEIVAAKWYASLLEGGRFDPDHVTLAGALAEYRGTDRYRELSDNSKAAYDRCWEIALQRLGRDTLIEDITEADLQTLRDDLLDDYSVNTVRLTMAAPMSRLFKYAHAKGWIRGNPLALVSIPEQERTPAHERDTLTDDQMDTLLDAAPSRPYQRLWAIYRWTGCRRLEGMRMRSTDVRDGWLHIRGTKNRHANRVMPILPGLEPYMENLPNGPLFTDSRSVAGKTLAKVARRNGFHATPVMFRRAFISRMRRQSRVPPHVWQRWVGHSGDTMARDHYDVADLEWERSLLL